MIIRTITTYDAVKLPVKKSFTCRVCGKRGTRSKTFRQTLNPWNRNAKGLIKSWGEIWRELGEEAQLWKPDMHERCEP
jgi:hypothetical protein